MSTINTDSFKVFINPAIEAFQKYHDKIEKDHCYTESIEKEVTALKEEVEKEIKKLEESCADKPHDEGEKFLQNLTIKIAELWTTFQTKLFVYEVSEVNREIIFALSKIDKGEEPHLVKIEQLALQVFEKNTKRNIEPEKSLDNDFSSFNQFVINLKILCSKIKSEEASSFKTGCENTLKKYSIDIEFTTQIELGQTIDKINRQILMLAENTAANQKEINEKLAEKKVLQKKMMPIEVSTSWLSLALINKNNFEKERWSKLRNYLIFLSFMDSRFDEEFGKKLYPELFRCYSLIEKFFENEDENKDYPAVVIIEFKEKFRELLYKAESESNELEKEKLKNALESVIGIFYNLVFCCEKDKRLVTRVEYFEILKAVSEL